MKPLLYAVMGITLCATTAIAQSYDPYGRRAARPAAQQHPTAELRISQLEEQIRQQQGVMERLGHEIKQLQEKITLMDKDMQMRFADIQKVQAMPATIPQASNVVPEASEPQAQAVQQAAYNFSNSREHYQHAFTLLNRGKFLEARAALNDFMGIYPKDPLYSNALYWMGETYYVERDYLQAADFFRRGYEHAPKGAKASDNLLKMAMSMAAMGEQENACVILAQLGTDYPDMAVNIRQKWDMERRRLRCS